MTPFYLLPPVSYRVDLLSANHDHLDSSPFCLLPPNSYQPRPTNSAALNYTHNPYYLQTTISHALQTLLRSTILTTPTTSKQLSATPYKLCCAQLYSQPLLPPNNYQPRPTNSAALNYTHNPYYLQTTISHALQTPLRSTILTTPTTSKQLSATPYKLCYAQLYSQPLLTTNNFPTTEYTLPTPPEPSCLSWRHHRALPPPPPPPPALCRALLPRSNNNNNNNRIQRRYSRSFTISSQRRELSPTRTLKWTERNRVQITCNTSSAYFVQVSCYVPLGTKGQLSY